MRIFYIVITALFAAGGAAAVIAGIRAKLKWQRLLFIAFGIMWLAVSAVIYLLTRPF